MDGKLKELQDTDLIATGFNGAFLGVLEENGVRRVVYNREECISILMQDGMSQEDAEDYFCYNVECAYVGEQTPIYKSDEDESYVRYQDQNSRIKRTRYSC